jgi:4-amino-4-deoxy-L-arabinose transferase-like glycosyltransferase
MELDQVATASEERTRLIAELGQLLFDGRAGVALLTSLCITVIYPLMRLNFGPKVAVLGLSLIALDPFFLALSRVFHIDAGLTSLMAVSLLGLLAALGDKRSPTGRLGLLALSGFAGGLAMLQKSPAAFLVPWTASLLAAYAWREGFSRQILRRTGRNLLLWSLVVMIVYVALWPAMWSEPLSTVRQVAAKAIGYAEEGHEPGNYFLGGPVQEPGWGYYPVAVSFRLSPLVQLGVIAALVWLVSGGGPDRYRFEVAALLLYGLLFGVFMNLGAKKLDRYLLPLFPALEIAAAVGLLALTETVRNRLEGMASRPLPLFVPVFLGILVIQIALVLPHYPHYLTYYNPLLGGLSRAKNALVVGWGEGYEKAAAYLNARPNARELQTAVPTFAAFAPLFSGETVPTSNYSQSKTDYVVFYLAQVQRQHDADLMERYFYNTEVEPEHTVDLHGVDYAWIYPNLHYVQPMDYLEEHGRPGQDILVVNADAVFGKHYQGALEAREFHSRSSPQDVAELLRALPTGSQRVWYARYSDTDPVAVIQLLRNRGLLVEQREFPDLKLVLYRLIEEPRVAERLSLNFGDLELFGYAPTRPLPAWGRDGGVLLWWESDQALEKDYTAFVHLYDARGQRIAQGDSLIVNRDLLPTSRWGAGSSGTTLHHLSIPPGTPPGQYELRVGVYVLETGERLPLLNAGAGEAETSARLSAEIGLPDQPPDVEDLDISHPLEKDIASQLRLLGYDLEHRAVLAGNPVPVRLYWKALGKIGQDYRLRLSLNSGDGTAYPGCECGLVATDNGTSQWRLDAVFQEWYDVPVDDNLTTGEMALTLNLVDLEGRSVLEQPVELASVWVQSEKRSFQTPNSVDNRCKIRLGDAVRLLGYDLEVEEEQPGDTLKVTLYWRADAQVGRSYKVFVHLYDRDGSIVGQRDQAPGLGTRPTTSWEQGEVVADRYYVKIDPELPPGTYSAAVGMYDPGTSERLPAVGPGGERLRHDSIPLGEVEVEG